MDLANVCIAITLYFSKNFPQDNSGNEYGNGTTTGSNQNVVDEIARLPNGCAMTINTCAFDSIYPIYCAALMDHPQFNRNVSYYHEFSTFIEHIVKGNRDMDELLRLRVNVVSNNGNETLFWNDKINIFGLLVKFFDSLKTPSYTQSKYCDCGRLDVKQACIPMHLAENFMPDFRNIQKNINFHATIPCGVCDESQCQNKVANVIAFDTWNNPVRFEDLQKQILVLDQPYELFGIIGHDKEALHYISYVRRVNDKWEIYDDLDTMKKHVRKPPDLEAAMLFYKKISK